MDDDMVGVPESEEAPIPFWLKIVYVTMIVFGLFWLVMNWDGPWHMIDPGHWRALEKAANTTFKH